MGGKHSKSGSHSEAASSSSGLSKSSEVSSLPAEPPPPDRPPKRSADSDSSPPAATPPWSSKKARGFSEEKASQFFAAYVQDGADSIAAEGVERLCADLGVEPTDLAVLALAWKCDVKEACAFSREEFLRGCRAVQTDNVSSLKKALPGVVKELDKAENFSSLYKFTFGFGLDKNETRMPGEMAVNLWSLVFSRNPPPLLEKWCEFCSSYSGLMVSRDTWTMFLPFVRTIKPDLSNYDDDSAWPNVMDEFVEAQLAKS